MNGHHHPASLAFDAAGRRPEEGFSPAIDRPTPPADCRRILIVGAGGFGREVLQWARDAWPDHAGRIAGFLSSDDRILDRFNGYPEIAGPPEEFRPEHGDYLLLAIGLPAVRRQVAELLLGRDAAFLTLIHPTAIVADTARIAVGSVICPYAVVSDSVQIGRFVLLNYHASAAHDAVVGDFAVLSPYATLGGGAIAAEDSFLGMHATLGPTVTLGARAKIAAQSALLHDAPADALAFGVPARITAGLR